MNQNMINDKEQRIERIGNCFITSCSKVHTLRYALILVMMVIGVTGLWGQASTIPDDDGYYYITNNNTDYYLKPANVEYESGMPYLTTNQTGQVSGSLWIIKSNGNYHQIIHAEDMKYVTIHDPKSFGTDYGEHRARMHLESIITPSDKNDFVFVKVKNSDKYNIRHKSVTSGTNIWWNPANGNNTNDDGGQKGWQYLIGLYNKEDVGGSLWKLTFIKKCVTPEINLSADGEVTITTVTPGASIYYTTDGSTTPSASETPYSGDGGTGPFTITEAKTIKAIVIKDGFTNSEVATATFYQTATPIINLTEDGRVELTCETEGSRIYYEIGNTAEGVTTPTTSSTLYSGPIENAAGKYIKAIAVTEGWIKSEIATSSQIVFSCATPFIRKASATTFTITCSFPPSATSDVTIRYNMGNNPADPTASTGTIYTGPVSFSVDDLPFTVKAIAVATNYNNSVVAEQELTKDLTPEQDGYYYIRNEEDFATFIKMANGSVANGKYKITANINATGSSAISTTFTGELTGVAKADGNFPVISNLDHPLFNTIDGGMVKNIMLDGVQISKSGNVGAITGEACGYTRIYNCGILPSTNEYVSSTDGYCGGLVGWLKDDSRVINCFSYANITDGTDVAGIVGHNEIASTTAVTDGKYANLRTAVVNCMFYGDITGGSSRYPVYGGEKIVNNTATGINNYDFYRANASLGTLTDYNCSWPAKEEYLTKYEFYRNLLNSNRELCGWWVGAPSAPSEMSTTQVQTVAKDASLMAKWVLDTEIAPYPILKKFGKYSSPVNIDADALWRTTANEWEGKKLGTIKVTINPGTYAASGVTSTPPTDYIITDMDTLRNDYCYRKIQLPYYNTVFGNPDGETWAAKYGGNYGDYVVIGWKVSTSEGTTGKLTENWETGYNFADRNCTAKDANRIFAQGGYYYVPNGVENITITAQWASAIYLDNTDHYYDRVSVSSYTYDGGVKGNVGSSTFSPFAPAGTRPGLLGNGKSIQNGSISNMIPNNGSVYNNAIVLVGNYQYFTGGSNVKGSNDSYGCTIMSTDFNCDNEPDYCLEWQLGTKTTRQTICPIRFDFLPVAELGMALKEDGSTQYYSLGCYHPLGHFEVTETALIHFGQFEFSNQRTVNSPIILNGGIFDQYTKGTTGGANAGSDKITYIILGGNVKMPSFTPGAHVNKNYSYSTRHCAVNVLGGNIDYLYLTGNYNENIAPNQDNPHCYIDGGRFKQVAAAGKEGINGDVYFEINHSKIWDFYGGSTMDQSTGTNYKIVKGNIDVTINNSIVDKYCGGPKFGNMIYDENNYANGKTITTNATNTIFGVYYGGGNGGTSYVQYANTDGEQPVSDSFNWNGTGKLNDYTPGIYRNGNSNYMADYDMEIVNTSAGTNQNNAIYRSYFYAAQFSATNTGSITNNLTNCTVLTNFYGGGNLGGVKGNVTSTLDGTTHVYGSAFGAGFSASVPDVTIHAKNKTVPTINVNTGIITPQSGGTVTTYTWCYKNPTTNVVVPSDVEIPANVGTGNPSFTYNNKNYYYTEVSLENLGAVSGTVTLTIKGSSKIGTDNVSDTGNVYGGGDQSEVRNNTNHANASTFVNIEGNAEVLGNVYGGGNKGDVSGSTTVNIKD